MSETAEQAEQAYSNEDYPKAIEYLSSIIEVDSHFYSIQFRFANQFSSIVPGRSDYVNYVLIVISNRAII